MLAQCEAGVTQAVWVFVCNFTKLTPWRAFLGLSESPVISRRGESDGISVVSFLVWGQLLVETSEKPKPDSSVWQSQQKAGRTERSTRGAFPNGVVPLQLCPCVSGSLREDLTLLQIQTALSVDKQGFHLLQSWSVLLWWSSLKRKENERGFLKCRPLIRECFFLP